MNIIVVHAADTADAADRRRCRNGRRDLRTVRNRGEHMIASDRRMTRHRRLLLQLG